MKERIKLEEKRNTKEFLFNWELAYVGMKEVYTTALWKHVQAVQTPSCIQIEHMSVSSSSQNNKVYSSFRFWHQ